MRVLSTGLAALLGLALSSTASAQFNTQKPTPQAPTKGGVVQKGSSVPTFGGSGAPSGTIALSTDDCTSPTPISGPGSAGFDTTTATTSGFSGGGTCAAGSTSINQDLFWQWTATTAGSIEFNTFGSGFDTKLSVHSGTGCAATCVGYNDDTGGLQSQVIVPGVNVGDTFLIQVGGFSSASGVGTLNYGVLPPPPPTNDDCATPTAVVGTGPHAFDSSAATTGVEGQAEALCYAFGEIGVAKDLWFTWTAGTTDFYNVETCGQASFDTKIAVYDGAGCPAGSALACNDDATCGLQSVATFSAISGNTYTIQLGSFPGTAGTGSGGPGTFTLGVVPPPAMNDSCANPDVIVGLGNFAFDNTTATTGVEGQNETLCYAYGSSAMNNDVWFQWTAPASGNAEVTTCGLATFDTRIAVYPGAACPLDGTSIACNDDACGLQSLASAPVTAGQTYMIQIGTYTTGSFGTGQFNIDIPGGGSPFTAYCFGDGSGNTCPCGNTGGAGRGCDNNTGSTGGLLTGSGSNSVGGGDMVLHGSGLQPGQPGLYFQGDNAINAGLGIPNGDGLRCAGGNVRRIQVRSANALGESATTVNIGVQGAVSPGETKRYQLWYRNPATSPCGTLFNLTNGLETTWIP